MPSAYEEYLASIGTTPQTGTLGLSVPTPPPAPEVPKFTDIGNRMATLGGFGDQPGELKTVDQLSQLSEAEIQDYKKERAKARNLGIAESLIAIGEAFQGKPGYQNLLQRQKARQSIDEVALAKQKFNEVYSNASPEERRVMGNFIGDELSWYESWKEYGLKKLYNEGSQGTALIENVNALRKLREDYANETDPKKKALLEQQIKDFSALGSVLKYDASTKFGLTQAELLARQGLDLGEKPMTAAELSTDEDFGKFYSEYTTKGRGATNIANLERLDDAEQLLKIADQNGVALSGVTAGMISGYPTLESYLNPKGLIARERVEAVIQQSLRATLGAQFGEREGEQFIRRGYNPSLPPSENLERLIDLRASIQQLVESEQEAVKYYEENKTLRGYKGKMYNMDSFSRDLATDYKKDVVGLDNDALENAYMNAIEGSIWEQALSKEIERRYRLNK
jgi:hypothetical protein